MSSTKSNSDEAWMPCGIERLAGKTLHRYAVGDFEICFYTTDGKKYRIVNKYSVEREVSGDLLRLVGRKILEAKAGYYCEDETLGDREKICGVVYKLSTSENMVTIRCFDRTYVQFEKYHPPKEVTVPHEAIHKREPKIKSSEESLGPARWEWAVKCIHADIKQDGITDATDLRAAPCNPTGWHRFQRERSCCGYREWVDICPIDNRRYHLGYNYGHR